MQDRWENTASQTVIGSTPTNLCTEQVAEMLGHIGRKKVYELIKNGSIKTLPCGKGYKITKVSVIDYVLNR